MFSGSVSVAVQVVANSRWVRLDAVASDSAGAHRYYYPNITYKYT